MVEIINMKCNACGFVGNRLSNDWIELSNIPQLYHYDSKKMFACSKCGIIRIIL